HSSTPVDDPRWWKGSAPGSSGMAYLPSTGGLRGTGDGRTPRKGARVGGAAGATTLRWPRGRPVAPRAPRGGCRPGPGGAERREPGYGRAVLAVTREVAVLYGALKVSVGVGLKLAFRPWVEGREHVPATGPAILASNH